MKTITEYLANHPQLITDILLPIIAAVAGLIWMRVQSKNAAVQ